MPGVSIPSAAPNQLGQIGGMVGGVIGGIYGGPGGSAAGSKMGSMLLGSQDPSPGAVQGSENPDAITRRLQTQQDSPQAKLDEAHAALQQLPPEYQQQYGATIAAARAAAAQGSDTPAQPAPINGGY